MINLTRNQLKRPMIDMTLASKDLEMDWCNQNMTPMWPLRVCFDLKWFKNESMRLKGDLEVTVKSLHWPKIYQEQNRIRFQTQFVSKWLIDNRFIMDSNKWSIFRAWWLFKKNFPIGLTCGQLVSHTRILLWREKS